MENGVRMQRGVDLAVVDMWQAGEFLQRALEILDKRYVRVDIEEGKDVKEAPQGLQIGNRPPSQVWTPKAAEKARRRQGQKRRHEMAKLKRELEATKAELERVQRGKAKGGTHV